MTDMNDINKTHSQVIPTQNQSLNEKKDENRLHKNTSSSFKNTSFSKNKYKTDLMNMSNNLLKKPNAKRITSYCDSLSNQNEHINKSRRNDFNNGPTLRNEKVDADKYYQLCEENQKLKQDQEKLNEKFKDLLLSSFLCIFPHSQLSTKYHLCLVYYHHHLLYTRI